MKHKLKEYMVIEDSHNLYNKEIFVTETSMLFEEPIDIQSAEDWEISLSRQKIPYVLVYGKLGKQEGYVILCSNNTIKNNFSFPDYLHEGPKKDR